MYSSIHSAFPQHSLSMHFAFTPHSHSAVVSLQSRALRWQREGTQQALSIHSACTPHALRMQSACNQHALSMHVRFTQQRDHRAGGAQVRCRHATDGRKEPVGRGGRRGEHLHAAAFPNASSRVHSRRTCQGRERPPGWRGRVPLRSLAASVARRVELAARPLEGRPKARAGQRASLSRRTVNSCG